MQFLNTRSEDLELFWVEVGSGTHNKVADIAAGKSTNMNSYTGHQFVVKRAGAGPKGAVLQQETEAHPAHGIAGVGVDSSAVLNLCAGFVPAGMQHICEVVVPPRQRFPWQRHADCRAVNGNGAFTVAHILEQRWQRFGGRPVCGVHCEHASQYLHSRPSAR